MDLESELDRLYAVSLEEFTAERNRLAAALKDSGDADAAQRVKKLGKPSVAAWTLNQLARGNAEEIGDLYATRESLERASSAAELRELSSRRRDLVARLSDLAKQVLNDSSHGASHATVEKISQALLLGGTDEEQELLRRGRLTREPTGSDLDVFGLGGETEEDVEPSSTVPLKVQREVQRLRRDAERLQQEAAALQQEAVFAEHRAVEARAKANEAAEAADAARKAADEAAEAAQI